MRKIFFFTSKNKGTKPDTSREDALSVRHRKKICRHYQVAIGNVIVRKDVVSLGDQHTQIMVNLLLYRGKRLNTTNVS